MRILKLLGTHFKILHYALKTLHQAHTASKAEIKNNKKPTPKTNKQTKQNQTKGTTSQSNLISLPLKCQASSI